MSEQQATRLTENDLVQSYLDSLLREIGEVGEDTPVVVEEAVPAAVVEPAPVDTTPAPEPPAVPPLVLHSPVVPEAAEDTTSLTEALKIESALPEHDPNQERLVPDWGKQGFSGLVFEVAGLKMAAPLHLLGGICRLEDNLQTVAGQADWFMGLLRWNGKNLRVVDTARFVMPERLTDNSHRLHYQSVVVLGDSQWALAVDSADESVHLQSSEVRWKTIAGKRAWLAGTLLERLCALMDVETLVEQLDACDQSKNRMHNVSES
ncbi:MAG TPA: chemotaxis protein CheW [Pseudohongiella sp.]|nr:chemotaxis protein CheW [Pseudohongiella sp.]